MKKRIDRKLFKFYLWVGVGYFFLGLISYFAIIPADFFAVVFNNIWAVVYVIALNFILFEYTVPFVLRKRKTIIYNILLGNSALMGLFDVIFFRLVCLEATGDTVTCLYCIKNIPFIRSALENQMAYSTGSVFFFGIIRHIYNYIKVETGEQQLAH